MKRLLQFISQHMTVTQEDEEVLATYFRPESVKAKTYLLRKGNVEHYLYFIEKGLIKAFRNVDGNLVVEHLSGNGRFFTSVESFLKSSPSHENIQAITDCELWKISKPDFELLMNNDLRWKSFFNHLLNDSLTCKMDRIRDFQVLTARQRYEKFCEEFPSIALEVPIETLASYLGIEPQSLSRIRRQLIS